MNSPVGASVEHPVQQFGAASSEHVTPRCNRSLPLIGRQSQATRLLPASREISTSSQHLRSTSEVALDFFSVPNEK